MKPMELTELIVQTVMESAPEEPVDVDDAVQRFAVAYPRIFARAGLELAEPHAAIIDRLSRAARLGLEEPDSGESEVQSAVSGMAAQMVLDLGQALGWDHSSRT